MELAEAQKQIKQMSDFILNEATQKKADIEKKQEEEFSIEVHRMITQEKEKLRQSYEKKVKQIDTQYAIAKSMAINKQRLEKIKARQEVIGKIAYDAKIKLMDAMKNEGDAKKFVTSLITQGLLMLLENEVTVKCRECDVKLVRGCVEQAQKEYTKVIKDETSGKADKTCKITIDEKNYLPKPPVEGQDGPSCLGGVVLECQRGKITIDNTIDLRLKLVMEQDKPAIRAKLFPQKV